MGQDLSTQSEEKEVDGICKERWMEEIFTGSSVKLRDVMVVGTHNSFAKESSLPSKNSKLNFSLEKGLSQTCANLYAGKTFAKGLCRSWSPCQSQSIVQQLLDGVRYLDFRVTRKSEQMFEVCHSISYGALMPLLDEVKKFADDNPKEVIFLHFPHIYNSNAQQMWSLASAIILKFKDVIVSPKDFSLDSRLEDVWNSKKNVIIFFEETLATRAFPEYLWENRLVRNRWFNKNTYNELHQAVAKELKDGKSCGNVLWVIQAILSPWLSDVASSIVPFSSGSLKRLANDLAVRLPSCFKEFAEKWNWDDRRPNVILLDFYERSDLFPLITRVNIAVSRGHRISVKENAPAAQDLKTDLKTDLTAT